MLILALDTTTRAGSVALWQDGGTAAATIGDASRAHGQRLPGELVELLRVHGFGVGDVDVYAVAAGPGSFTGLRVGIATIQGLAFANQRRVVPVSALQALALAGLRAARDSAKPFLIGPWIDAQRHEVFSELYALMARGHEHSDETDLSIVEAAAVGSPEETLERWRSALDEQRWDRALALPVETFVWFVGDGVAAYEELIRQRLGGRAITRVEVLPLAALVAEIAARRVQAGEAMPPHAIKPIYVRRPDAEIVRDRSRMQS